VLVGEGRGRPESVVERPEQRLPEIGLVVRGDQPLVAVARLGERVEPAAQTDAEIDRIVQRTPEAGEEIPVAAVVEQAVLA
jgi:hypothetical protein